MRAQQCNDERPQGVKMKFSRRQALRLMGSAAPALAMQNSFKHLMAQSGASAIDYTPGKFADTRVSLKAYTVPDWFADAKFGIWSHWGPQSAVGDGDWYARNMYMQGSPQNIYHVKRFGHPSKVGYKDVIPLFTASRWDPEHLMDLYAKAGAKYFFSMGVHHDNFDLWNSKYQPKWNAVNMGPRKDVVGMWATAARKRGLRFGVSEHLSNSFDWLAPSHGSDATGPLAGVPYDGADPAYASLYHDYTGMPADFIKTAKAMGRVAPQRWQLEYFHRIKDLIDQHQPDLLYTDGGFVFDQYGLACAAELYNAGPVDQHGNTEAVYTSKTKEDCDEGACVLDHERGVSGTIWPAPWQTDTCIGQWHYNLDLLEDHKYKTPKKVIDLLVDIISKNGNLLLNFPLPATGELDADEMKILEGITSWMGVNAEGVFYTRPWKINGEGPSMSHKPASQNFNEGAQPDLGADDIRFTSKGKTLFAFIQGWPKEQSVIKALGSGSPQNPEKVVDVRLLGHGEALRFTQDATGLNVTMPAQPPAAAELGVTLKINFV
jgi:alpha-L-fucosidase